MVKPRSSYPVQTRGLESPEEADGEAAGKGVEEARGDCCGALLAIIHNVRGSTLGLLTGAELGGSTLPESETVHPLGSPG